VNKDIDRVAIPSVEDASDDEDDSADEMEAASHKFVAKDTKKKPQQKQKAFAADAKSEVKEMVKSELTRKAKQVITPKDA